MVSISIKAENLGQFFGLPITNSLLTTWLILFILLGAALGGIRKLKEIPTNLQTIAEIIVENWLNLCDSVGGLKAARYFPFVTTLFIFILLSNLLGLLPGLEALTLFSRPEGKTVPLFRSPTSDLNTTLALALVAFIYIEIEGIRNLGLRGHLNKFFINPGRDKIGFFVGILELLSEFTRIISFSFRLFGNVFAGEVLLAIMTFLIPLLIPVPFLGLEIFVSFIQAFVFAMLTLVFASLATVGHAAESSVGGESHH